MRVSFHRSLSWLALVTISGSMWANGPLRVLPNEALASVQQAEGSRAAMIAAHVDGLKANYGLKGSDELLEIRRSTDEFGKTHVHFSQAYQGVPVWGSGLIGHMDAQGGFESTQAKVFTGINLDAVDVLPVDHIQKLSLKRLSIDSTALPVRVDKVVFPTSLQDGVKLKRNEKGELVFDEIYSVATSKKAAPYVWAYHVTVLEGNTGAGRVTEMIVDASTGEVLKKWDGRNFDTPAIGHSQYNGNITVNTNPINWVNLNAVGDPNHLMPPSGTYNTLRDTTRTALKNPLWSYKDWMDTPGITTYWEDNYIVSGLMPGFVPFLNTGTEWGDGKPFAGFADGDQSVTIATANLTVNGQTAAVDATYGVLSTWDFYKNVFKRNGVDGKGTPPVIFVHHNEGQYQTMTPMLNAFWSTYAQAMVFGDGNLKQGYGPFTSVDVTAHELTHGVVSNSGQGLGDSGESGGLNEATADVFSAMTRFYLWGPDKGTGETIPDTAPNSPDPNGDYLWAMGRQISVDHSPFRTMYKPSLDGYSYDAWFDGMSLDDVHFTMGPGCRAFYFLSQGASKNTSDVSYSPCLPGGMTGLKNDKAARIWYRAITTKLANPNMDYFGFRKAMEDSASELYGAGSELAAVQNAFSAVGVGAPAGGSEPVHVVLATQIDNPANEAGEDGDSGWGYDWRPWSRFIVNPAPNVPVTLPAPIITNTTNTAFTWSLGGLSTATANRGGKVVDGKTFVAPAINHAFWAIKVASDQDPSRYAGTVAYACNMDSDNDTEFDALDVAAYAMSWGRSIQYFQSNKFPLLDISNNNMVDDNDVMLFKLGFNNVFAH